MFVPWASGNKSNKQERYRRNLISVTVEGLRQFSAVGRSIQWGQHGVLAVVKAMTHGPTFDRRTRGRHQQT